MAACLCEQVVDCAGRTESGVPVLALARVLYSLRYMVNMRVPMQYSTVRPLPC